MSKVKYILYSISVLSGTIIGVGFFSLPFVALKSGILITLFYLVFLGIVSVLIHRFFCEVSLKTPDFLRLAGFAKIHLGKNAQKVALVSSILGLFGSILAYIIVGGEFLSILLKPFLGGSDLFYLIIYFSLGSFLIYSGVKAISKVEFLSLIVFFFLLIILFFEGNNTFNLNNFNILPKKGSLFLPYGVVLFSLWGASLIPEVEEMLKEKKNILKNIIPFSILIPMIVYIVFTFLVVGISGEHTTESSLAGLKEFLSPGFFRASLVLGLLATFTSFITLGLTLKKVFCYDLKIGKDVAWFLTCFVPLLLFFLGFRSFINVIGLVGGVMMGIDAILILLMYKKIKKGSFVFPLILIFLGGIVYEIIILLR
jgi:tyrosine-specific transport protein